ncbi:MAG: tetratricopeptide repeat protein [Desulfovibrio sp.]
MFEIEDCIQRGELLWRQGHSMQSLAVVEAAFEADLKRDPNNMFTWFNKGNMLWERSHYDEALAAYDHALTLAPDDPVAQAGRDRGLGASERELQ